MKRSKEREGEEEGDEEKDGHVRTMHVRGHAGRRVTGARWETELRDTERGGGKAQLGRRGLTSAGKGDPSTVCSLPIESIDPK